MVTDSEYWLNQMEKNPKSIYTSDGDANRISFPKSDEAKLNSKYADKANALRGARYRHLGSDASVGHAHHRRVGLADSGPVLDR